MSSITKTPANLKKPGGGRRSKNKGRNQEYACRDYLRKLGWTAERVYASGAIAGLPGDIKATKNGRTVLFELKTRKASFGKVYDLYAAHLAAKKDDVFAAALPGAEKLCVEMSNSLDALLDSDGVFEVADSHPCFSSFKRTFGKLKTMQEWVKSCEILVIKDDRRPYLFLRYR
jgi:hypothetical protein